MSEVWVDAVSKSIVEPRLLVLSPPALIVSVESSRAAVGCSLELTNGCPVLCSCILSYVCEEHAGLARKTGQKS